MQLLTKILCLHFCNGLKQHTDGDRVHMQPRLATLLLHEES